MLRRLIYGVIHVSRSQICNQTYILLMFLLISGFPSKICLLIFHKFIPRGIPRYLKVSHVSCMSSVHIINMISLIGSLILLFTCFVKFFTHFLDNYCLHHVFSIDISLACELQIMRKIFLSVDVPIPGYTVSAGFSIQPCEIKISMGRNYILLYRTLSSLPYGIWCTTLTRFLHARCLFAISVSAKRIRIICQRTFPKAEVLEK